MSDKTYQSLVLGRFKAYDSNNLHDNVVVLLRLINENVRNQASTVQ
jgi:hypothetical protein